uniref:Histone H2A n=1 Tax=Solanum tuberosum TaxID=4113 RepID=M1DU42_SOLTU
MAVARIAQFLKVGKYAKCVGVGAPVFLVAVLEYLATEVLELAGIAARNDKKTRIIPRHIQLAIRFDAKLCQFLRDMTILNGGVIPNIHNIFLPKRRIALQRPPLLFLRRGRRIRLIIPSLVSRCSPSP